jgi:hypothetical protein
VPFSGTPEAKFAIFPVVDCLCSNYSLKALYVNIYTIIEAGCLITDTLSGIHREEHLYDGLQITFSP